MPKWMVGLVVAGGCLVASWGLLLLLARRLPPGILRDLAAFIPDCVTTVRRLRKDPRVPRRAKIAIVVAGLWVASPIDLIPEFLPVIGPLDDIVVVALALRYAGRQVPREVLLGAWPGDPRLLERLLGPAGGPRRRRTARRRHDGEVKEGVLDSYEVGGVSVRRFPAAGDRAPVVLVHGGAHGSWCWDNLAAALNAAGWDVHALDWLNHGGSAVLPADQFVARGIVDVAQVEITAVVARLGRQPVLVGHSMGGLAALAYAAQAPVDRLVLLAPVVPACVGAEPIELPVDPATPFGPPPYELAKQIFFSTMDDDAARRYHALLVPESACAVHQATRWTVEVDPGAVTVPTLVVGADADVLTPAAAVRRLAEAIPGARYEQISGAGHSDLLLKDGVWRPVADLVRDWLAAPRRP